MFALRRLKAAIPHDISELVLAPAYLHTGRLDDEHARDILTPGIYYCGRDSAGREFKGDIECGIFSLGKSKKVILKAEDYYRFKGVKVTVSRETEWPNFPELVPAA